MNRADFLNYCASQTPAVNLSYSLAGAAFFGLAILGKQKQLRSWRQERSCGKALLKLRITEWARTAEGSGVRTKAAACAN